MTGAARMTGVRKKTAATLDRGLPELGPKALIGGRNETYSENNQPPGSPPRGAEGAVSNARWSRKLKGIEAI